MGADILDPHGPLQHRALGLAEVPAAEMIAARDWLAPRRRRRADRQGDRGWGRFGNWRLPVGLAQGLLMQFARPAEGSLSACLFFS